MRLYFTPIDLLWLGMASLWALFGIVALYQYVYYLYAARQIVDKSVREIALTITGEFVRAELSRLFSHFSSIFIGLIAASIPPVPRQTPNWRGQAIILGLFMINILCGVNSINALTSFQKRRRLVKRLTDEEYLGAIDRQKGGIDVHGK